MDAARLSILALKWSSLDDLAVLVSCRPTGLGEHAEHLVLFLILAVEIAILVDGRPRAGLLGLWLDLLRHDATTESSREDGKTVTSAEVR